MKKDYSIGFSNIISEESRYQIKPGDQLEVLINKWSPLTELWTVSAPFITNNRYHLGFLLESGDATLHVKGFIMCRIPNKLSINLRSYNVINRREEGSQNLFS